MNRLSEREKQVLACLCKGMILKEVGVALDIATNTVKQHVGKIRAKIGARTLAHAAAQYVSEFGMPE